MSLASYFGRTATAASQVLQAFDARTFEGLLNGLVIGIAFGDDACSSEGRANLDLLVRLVSRFYPTICLLPAGEQSKKLARSLGSLARSINGQITILPRKSAKITQCLVIGSADPQVSCPKLYAGSDGWLARFSPNHPMASGTSDNMFGAGAAACIAAANLFRLVFSGQLGGVGMDGDVTFSLFDYLPGSNANPPLANATMLDDMHLLGVGAIGNGTLWALARVEGLQGRLSVVDAEELDQSNLQRYVMALERDVGQSKVKLARRYLKGQSAVVVEGQGVKWQTLAAMGSLRNVAVALDTAADRIAVQAALPRRIVNSWTQRGDLGVSHHDFGGEMACLACLYLPNGVTPSEDQVVAQALGLEDRIMDVVRPMLHNGAPVTPDLMREIAGRLTVPPEPLLPFVGQPLRNFYQGTICGGVVFELTGGGRPVQVEIPMAFQSAMAGVMLAAEIVKGAGGNTPAWTTAKLNLQRKMPRDVITERRRKDQLGRCICQDSDYTEAYGTLYP
ncbi:E2 ligase fold family C protein [Aminobacter sp. MDW-2]|jgi:hypothetical protein|uniref:E2 ligase fold family C protein n=1 Tax=Aminobacter sp. MDW-2 TaxID=2666139 RepID=UPI0012B0A267|nr:E2 ligase fold family C protein [Aminobacter sp. MDW-2]MRX37376.1 hypothetical protein [Aminobacter sp. MDW-2]QNH35587.1 E2 ligase fold family C protein [Aminobacter sp. MDW-2]